MNDDETIETKTTVEPTLIATVRSDVLREMIAQVAFAADKGVIARPVFTGVLVRVRDGALALVACDAFRLALATTTVLQQFAQPGDMILPATFLRTLAKALPHGKMAANVTIASAGGVIVFTLAGSATFVTAPIEGVYPKFEAIIPRKHTARAKAPGQTLFTAARRALADAKAADLADMPNADDTIPLATITGMQWAADGVLLKTPVQSDHGVTHNVRPAFRTRVKWMTDSVYLDTHYLADAAKALAAAEVVTLDARTPQDAVMLSGSTVVSGHTIAAQHIIMPMHKTR